MEEKGVEKKRVVYLDIIKAISIFLVVFCHFPTLNTNSRLDNISMILCWAAVPCFFMTTGAIFLNKKYCFKKYIYRIISIYATICIWKAIYLLFYQCIGKIDILSLPKNYLFNYIFLFDGLDGITTGHLWFMYSYLQILIIYPLLNLCFNNFKEYKSFIILVIVVLILMGFVPNSVNLVLNFFNIKGIAINNVSKINPFGSSTAMLLFYIIGGIVYRYNIYEKFENKKIIIRIISFIVMIIGIVGLVFIKKCQSGTLEWRYIWLVNGYNYISTIIMSVGLFIFLQGIQFKFKFINKIFTIIGKNTMGIFYLHVLVLEFRSKINFVHKGSLVNGLKSLAIVIICVCISGILKKIPLIKKLVE